MEEFQNALKAHSSWIEVERVKSEESFVRRDIETAIRNLERDLRNLALPACSDQIEQCINIQAYLRTHVLKESVAPLGLSSVSAALSGRQVEKVTDDMVLKKEQINDPYSIVSSKKSSKTTSKKPTGEATGSIKLPFWVISALEELKVNMVTTAEEAKIAIAKLDSVKSAFEAQQTAKLSTVDSEKAVLQERLTKQIARLENVAEEAAQRLKAHATQRKSTATKTVKNEADPAVPSPVVVAVSN